MFGWFKKQRLIEQRYEPKIHFLYEQDGPPEREVKALLAERFRKSGLVQRAYLVRAYYGDPIKYEVALCLRAKPDPAVLQIVGECFKIFFAADAHLDTLFLSDEQEAEVQQVCAPFFEAQ